MISRIETITDLVEWLNSIATLEKKIVDIEKLTDNQVSVLISAQEILAEIEPRFPGPFKQCCKCKAVYPETKEWFDWSGQGRTGLHAVCKFCRNAYQKKHKTVQKAKQNNYGYSCQADLDEVNYYREKEGLPPLSTAPAKRGRPKGSKTKKTISSQHIPEVGEKW